MSWPERIESAVREILAVVHELNRYEIYSHVIPAPRPPATEHAIRQYEQRLGMRLPASYSTFLRMYNGFDWLAFPGHMLSIEDSSPGGEYWPDIKEWKLGMSDAGLAEALDGVVIAYLDQPNNWAYLDPDRSSGEELQVALHVPGVDPDYYPDVAAFLESSAGRARLALSWCMQRSEQKV
jgi:cell wall assembly regulator SMI1